MAPGRRQSAFRLPHFATASDKASNGLFLEPPRSDVAVDIVVGEWNLELDMRRQASGSRVIASSEDAMPSISSHRAADSDETLMQRYQRGSELAFHELYGRYRDPLLRYIRRLSHGPEEHEEIAQETWMAVIQGRERYVRRARFVTYLFSIAHRRTLDRWRRRGRAGRYRRTYLQRAGRPCNQW
jgi:hypothetical protein